MEEVKAIAAGFFPRWFLVLSTVSLVLYLLMLPPVPLFFAWIPISMALILNSCVLTLVQSKRWYPWYSFPLLNACLVGVSVLAGAIWLFSAHGLGVVSPYFIQILVVPCVAGWLVGIIQHNLVSPVHRKERSPAFRKTMEWATLLGALLVGHLAAKTFYGFVIWAVG